MYRFIFITFFIFIIIPINEEPVMAWDEHNKLSWNDFKAKPNYSVNAVATTASGITFGFSIKETDNRVISFETEIHAHFYPEKSWYKPELSNAHILAHEQLHFDITELYARKFRKRAGLLKTSNDIGKRLRSLHKIINRELAALQDRYDNDTDFSRNFEAQAKWQSFIQKELSKLQYFKSKN